MANVMLSRPSVASLLLVPMLGDKPLAQAATGFVVHDAGTYWLVTNWHVVSGRRTDDGQPLSQRTGATPDRLRVAHNVNGQVAWVEHEYELLTPHGEPRWVEHPVLRRRVDVVALRISPESGVQFYPYELDEEGDQLAAGMGEGLSIIGFPFGRTGGGRLAIWVKGWVATEPGVDFDGLPCFLVDSRTRPGQSGSPVIAFVAGGAARMESGSTNFYDGPITRFMGIYSGRISEESDLGVVWKRTTVAQVIRSGVPGNGDVRDAAADSVTVGL